jgi:hypothetical protein
MIQIERNPPQSQLRVFAILWLIFFGYWGTEIWRIEGARWIAFVLWFVALIVPAVGSMRPGILRVAYVAACYITFPIGFLVSSAVLMAIYYLVLTPIGIALRMTGYDPMKKNFDRAARTYWTPRKTEVELERYFKQF